MKQKTPKYESLFNSGYSTNISKGHAIRSGMSVMIGEGSVFILRIGSTIVLARLLMPEHFGLIGMVYAIIAIAERFKDLGLSTATIQRKEITHEQVSTLFWINAVLGLMVMLVVASLSYVIAWYYGDHRLVAITAAFSLSFLFGGLAVQHQALLRRQMRFGSLAWIQFLSTLLSTVIGIAMAVAGFEYWALVWKEVFRAVFITVGTWYVCEWRPGLPVRGSGVASMISFGGDLSAFNLIVYFSRNLDMILIGKFGGAGPLGYYRQAKQLVSEPIYQLRFPVESVAEPLLSTAQNEPEKYQHYYKKILSTLAFISMPLIIYLGIYAENIVRVLLGPKWLDSIPLFRLLAIAAFVQPLVSTCGFVMVTLGQTRKYLFWGVLNSISVILAYSIGIRWGTLGICVAYVIHTYVSIIPSLWYSFTKSPLSISLFVRAVRLPALASLLMGIVLFFTLPMITALNSFVEIPLSMILAITVYCGAWLPIPGGRKELLSYLSYPFHAFRSKTMIA